MSGERTDPGQGALDTVQRWLTRIDHLAATGAAVAMLAMMAIVFVDVFMRYVFNAPLAWSYDFISLYLTTLVFFLVLSETLRTGHHVSVDILYRNLPLRWRQVCKLIGWSLTFVLFAIILVLALRVAWSRLVGGNVIAGAIPWPTWIPAAIASLGLVLLLLRLGVGMLALAMNLFLGRPLPPTMAGEDVATQR